MTIIEALRNLGLNEKEAKVYLTLLKLGEASAYMVADSSSLKRPTTYVILEELMKKGLVSRVPRTRKQLYVAKPPEELFSQAEEKVRLAKESLPELLAIAQGEKPKVRALYFEGVNGLEETLEYGLKEMAGKEFLGFYAYVENAPLEVFSLFDRYNEKLKKSKIKIRGLAPDHPNLKKYRDLDAEYGRTIKTVPRDQYSSTISIDIADTFVRLLAPEEQQGLVIENPAIAKSLRQIFEIVWKKQ